MNPGENDMEQKLTHNSTCVVNFMIDDCWGDKKFMKFDNLYTFHFSKTRLWQGCNEKYFKASKT